MTQTIKGHFDGRVIVLDEPADLPVNRPLTMHVEEPVSVGSAGVDPIAAALSAFLARAAARPVATISDEQTRREAIYEDQ
jgi:hypothetical protein